jgi:polyisoprenoid-binding protein YceI
MKRAMQCRVVLCVVLAAAVLSLDACRTSPSARSPTPVSKAPVVVAPPPAATRYTIDAEHSQVLVLAYRDGPMAHLGHNHVIGVRNLSGTLTMGADPSQATFQMDFPVEAMSVDDAALRSAQGQDFQTTVDEAAIAGTRDHMLGPALLNSKQYPQIHLASGQVHGSPDHLTVLTGITVRDTTAQVEIPVALQTSGDEVTASGEFDLTHAQLGLTPYSVALGALRVAERLHVKYRLIAHRQP